MAFRQISRIYGMTSSTGVRCLSLSAVRSVDPIQQLFADKVRDYMQKSKAAGGKLVDADAELEKELEESLSRTLRQFGGKNHEDMAKFPTFSFQDPKLDPINMEQKA